MAEKILVVDDEREIADLIEVYLRNENYGIVKCYSGQEALRWVEREEMDLAILDIMLPDVNGFAVCQKIRERYTYPIIMLTAKDEEVDKITGLSLGADDYMTKPFRPLEMVARVKAQLRRYKRYNQSRKEEGEIHLPSELYATEQKLNAVKRTLKQRTLEAQLAEQKKNELVMYLAHDIRTPLTSVIGYLNLLEEAPELPEKQRANYVHISLEKAYRLEKMINEFFEITRYNLQQITLQKERIDLYYMLVQLIDEMTPLLSKKNNRAQLHADENLTVYGDADKLARVFQNVLRNAAVYSFPGTQIEISAEENGGAVEIVFRNEGHTIPEEKLNDIFEKFYRLDEGRNSYTGGFGLGLAIAREIVTLHGGSITAKSADDRVEFRIRIPG